jgi:hypothetical protein
MKLRDVRPSNLPIYSDDFYDNVHSCVALACNGNVTESLTKSYGRFHEPLKLGLY